MIRSRRSALPFNYHSRSFCPSCGPGQRATDTNLLRCVFFSSLSLSRRCPTFSLLRFYYLVFPSVFVFIATTMSLRSCSFACSDLPILLAEIRSPLALSSLIDSSLHHHGLFIMDSTAIRAIPRHHVSIFARVQTVFLAHSWT